MTAIVAAAFLLALSGATLVETRSNYAILRSMPRERRLVLAERLAEFERLTRQEQDAIRSLDQSIQKLSIEERERYLAVARRYMIALNSLSPEQKSKVESEPEATRLNLLLKFTSESKANRPTGRQPVLDMDSSDFLTSPPYEFAHAIRFWIGLTSTEQAEINKLPSAQRYDRLRLMIKKSNDPSPTPDEAVIARATTRQNNLSAIQKKFNIQPKAQTRLQARFRDAMILSEMTRAKVAPGDLDRFEAAIPSWLHEPLDALPPDAYHKRLGILYRIAYPLGSEMPKTKPKDVKSEPKSPPPPKAVNQTL